MMFYFSEIPSKFHIRHVLHLHGYSFQVIKTGYPELNLDKIPTYKGPNVDVKCMGPHCNQGTWANTTWLNGQVPDIVTSSPPLKDTVAVPYAGYVVIRFRTDNPGKSLFTL